MKLKLVLVAVFVTFLLMVLAVAVLALENPFSWSDASAQEAGKGIYQRSCLGCHGANGSSMARADFSAVNFSQGLAESPDFYFSLLTDGKLDKGMPPFKSSLSEEQRWQVLTYLWSLGTPVVPPEESPTSAKPPAEEVGGILLLTASEQAQAGQPVTLSAVLQDSQSNPIKSATIDFFIRVEFFTSGLIKIGQALTNDSGVATFNYTPRGTGDLEVVARYEASEAAATLTSVETGEPFYQPEAGIRLPTPGQEIFIGPKSAEGYEAPTATFRLPGGILSWLMLFVAVIMLVWITYFRVVYQVFRIPIAKEIRDTDTRLVPLLGLAIVVIVGLLLVWTLVTGPNSHLHLLR